MMDPSILCLAIMSLASDGALKLSDQGVRVACENSHHIVEYSWEQNLEPELMAALIYTESRFTPNAVSSAGACGLTQVLPHYSRPKMTCKQLQDPENGIKAGTIALDYWRTKRKKKKIKEALACYNAGNKCLDSKRGASYSRYVLRRYKLIKRAIDDLGEDGCEYDIPTPSLDFQFMLEYPNKRLIAVLKE